ncbi:MAG: hypothetical protein Kow00124_19800 [Anaerolineae bacterium]
MAALERSIFINGTTDEIDAITLDPWRLPEWYEGVEHVEPDGVYPEPGGVVNMTYRAAGIAFTIKMTCLELVRGEYALYQMEGMMSGTNRWIHTPEGNGTWLTAQFEYELPGGGLGKAFDRLVVERMNAENLEKSLARLKELVEAR